MPLASRVLVRAALLHLLAGASLGTLLLLVKAVPGILPAAWSWRPAHVEMLTIGFTLQLAFGVAFWILPRDADAPPSPVPAWAALALLNAGVLAVSLGPVLDVPLLAPLGRVLEAGAVATFASHAWPRVRGWKILAA